GWPARSCGVANRTICSCIELSFRYGTPIVSARRVTRFQQTAAPTSNHGNHDAVRPTGSLGGRTARRVTAGARAGRVPTAVTRSTASVTSIARGIARGDAAHQMERALGRVAGRLT